MALIASTAQAGEASETDESSEYNIAMQLSNPVSSLNVVPLQLDYP